MGVKGGVVLFAVLLCVGSVLARPAPVARSVSGERAQVLFSGRSADVVAHWRQAGSEHPAPWKVVDGAMVASVSNISTVEKFQDFYLHLEFYEPFEPEHHGQERANSGVFLQGRYEIQVLDSYGIADPGTGDCGAVYSEFAPLVNACKPPLHWQTYDMFFRTARLDPQTHQVTEPARVTILQNGIVIQSNVPIRPNGGALDNNEGEPGPLMLQFHGNPVRYRNIRMTRLPEHGALHY